MGGYGGFSHLALPALTLGLLGSGWYSRMLRSSMIEVLHQDFIRTARAKGLGPNPRTAASRAAECRAAANSDDRH
jgi:ABC-type dipeptide/oligopeptide/nickel transport system permease component